MSKTTEALKLMMEALEMQIHGAGSIIHSKLAWQAGHEALAEPVKQEPVSKQRILALAKQERVLIPGLIGFQDNLVEFARVIAEEALQTVAPVYAKAIRAEALEEAAKVCEQGTGDAIQTETLKLLLQERGRITSVIRRLK